MKVFRFVICIAAAAAVLASLCVDYVTRPVWARTSDVHVVIDAGHGGMDGGAQSRNGTKEADINLAIAKFLETEFKARDVGVTMTRSGRDNLASPFLKNKKKDDMDKRRQIIEKVTPDLVISIHLNNFPSHPAVRGLQTFYEKNSEYGKLFAEAIQKEFNSSDLNINRTAAIGDYYILNCTEYPSVLVECGFLSNPDDERLLKTTGYQKILAYYIAKAVVQSFQNNS